MGERILTGLGSSPGIVIGQLIQWPKLKKTLRKKIHPSQIPSELRHLATALKKTKEEWRRTQSRLSRFYPEEQIQILGSYLLWLEDENFQKMARGLIEKERKNASWALQECGDYLKKIVKKREDVDPFINKILQTLLPQEKRWTPPKDKNNILVADSLSPAHVAGLSKQRIAGFLCKMGSMTSHALILARSLKIPAICGIENLMQNFKTGQKAILNGFEAKLHLDPTPQELKNHQELASKHEILEKLLQKEATKEACTKDGIPISFEANVELMEEIKDVLKYGAQGIGLFRSESLFWDKNYPPGEEEQTKYYEEVLLKMKGGPVTFRTLDILGEEWMGRESLNPNLGLRGIRFSLKETSLLKTQLRALLRASTKGPVKILLPMVSQLEEVEGVFFLLEEMKTQLKNEKIPFAKKTPLGIMLEVPSVCLIADILANYCDFFSIGTNDLLQYTLAVDRNNEQVANLYTPFHPAIVRLLQLTIQKIQQKGKPLFICGELGGDPLFLPILIGLGLTHFSMAPLSIPKAKKIVRQLTLKQCKIWLKELLELHRIHDIREWLRQIALELDS